MFGLYKTIVFYLVIFNNEYHNVKNIEILPRNAKDTNAISMEEVIT